MKQKTLVCLDIGGTNLRIGMVNKSCELLDSRIVSTSEYSSDEFLSRLTNLIEEYRTELSSKYTVCGVSLGVPATVSKDHRIVLQAPNVKGLDNKPVADILEKALKVPVYLDKDVNLLLSYDLNDNKLPSDSVIVGIYFGTGIGNSIYINGKMLSGKNGVAGELGHIPQINSNVRCGCGNENCLEPIGGGRQLQALCNDVFKDTPVSEIYVRHSDTPEVKKQLDCMAVAVATEVNILDPDYVIIGGGLPQMEGFPKEYFLKRIKDFARKPYPMENLEIRFARPNHENGIIGAGILGWKAIEK
ncbi:MAG: allose kinase [Clostridia bacterium]|nr:allose kinase [Clostridia bacterium]